MTDLLLLAGLAGTLGIMSIGIKLWGVGGGFAGFFLGAILTGLVAAGTGIELGGGCVRYSHYASDC